MTQVGTEHSNKLREEIFRNPDAYIGQAVKVAGKVKKAGKLQPAPRAGIPENVIKGLPALLTYKYLTGPYLHEGIERHKRMMQAVREGWPAGMAAE